MKKIWICMSACLLLMTGCAKYSADYQQMITDSLNDALSVPASSPDYSKAMYSYYVQPSIGRISSTASSNTFNSEGTQFVMNLEVQSIVNSAYYPDQQIETLQISDMEPAASESGTYTDYSGNECSYSVRIYEMDGDYYILFYSQYMHFFAVTNKVQSAGMVEEMMQISKSIRINEEKILSSYSSHRTISNTRKELQLFEQVAPENGSIEELFTDKTQTGEETESGGQSGTGEGYATDNYQEKGNTDDTVPEAAASAEATEAAE